MIPTEAIFLSTHILLSSFTATNASKESDRSALFIDEENVDQED